MRVVADVTRKKTKAALRGSHDRTPPTLIGYFNIVTNIVCDGFRGQWRVKYTTIYKITYLYYALSGFQPR